MKQVMIKAAGLSKEYQTGSTSQKVLKDISLNIYKGDFTVIMGSSGSGKSTLLYALSYMDKPTNGTVIIDGKEWSYHDKELAKLHSSVISFVFQSSNLIPDLTGFENITYPTYMIKDKKEANESAKDIMKKFAIEDVCDKYPGEMSGGQQQRVAIARALNSTPGIIFADEPTGALDSSSGEQVLDMFSQINKEGNTIIMVTHDIKTCARGNRLLYLKDGCIADELSMGQYNASEQKKREEKIFNFIARIDSN